MYEITIYFDVEAGTPLYGVGFTLQVEAPSSLSPEVTQVEEELRKLLEAGKIIEWEVGS